MKNILIAACAPILFVFLTSCASTGGGSPNSSLAPSQYAFPEWVLHPPLEDTAIYGVGSGETRPAAHIESLVDISYKLEVQINTVLAERSRGPDPATKKRCGLTDESGEHYRGNRCQNCGGIRGSQRHNLDAHPPAGGMHHGSD